MTAQSNNPPSVRPDWLPEAEYPFQIRNMKLGEQSVAYVDEGKGSTLLFVHTGMWSFIFRDVILRLRDDFRCITLDFPGFGLSPDPAGDDLGLEAQAQLLERFVIKLGLDDLTLIMHDLGGVVGTGFAASRPDLIAAFVMSNTFVWKPDSKKLTRMLAMASRKPITVLDSGTRLIPRLTAGKSGVGLRLTKSGRKAFLGPFRDRLRITRFHSMLRDALQADDLYTRLESATSGVLSSRPVLTIFGEKNDPFDFQERHRATFADHESLVISNGNHFPMMDDPDLFAATVREWVRRKVTAYKEVEHPGS